MKRALLLGLAMMAGVGSATAGNVLVNGGFDTGTFKGWTIVSDEVAIDTKAGDHNSGAYSAKFGQNGQLEQTFATVVGTTYYLRYSWKTPESGTLEVGVLDANGNGFVDYGAPASPSFSIQTIAFTARTTKSTVDFFGTDAVLDTVIVATGYFSKPGKYTGTLTTTQTLTPSGIVGSHTESVVARINATGGISMLTEPDGAYFGGVFLNDVAIALEENTFAAVLKGDDLSFTASTSGGEQDIANDGAITAETTSYAFVLKWVGN